MNERFLHEIRRTHHCNVLTAKDANKTVCLMGWVHRRRDHGGLIFIDLRDREGLTQVVLDPSTDETAHAVADKIRSEYVIAVLGTVMERPKDMINSKLHTGEIEVRVKRVEVLSEAKTPPFQLDEYNETNEMVRLRYRYLDLRRKEMQDRLILRSKICQETRRFFSDRGFVEVETPVLYKSTPEGARDYLVPSRVWPGQFFALP
jgi:aspartyl-tRNA synthetase